MRIATCVSVKNAILDFLKDTNIYSITLCTKVHAETTILHKSIRTHADKRVDIKYIRIFGINENK